MSPRSRASRVVGLLLASTLALVACAAGGTDPAPAASVGATALRTSDPDAALTLVADGADHESSLATSRALFDASPVAVVAPSGDSSAQALSARAAVALGAPLLIDAPRSSSSGSGPSPSAADELSRALADELQRLGTTRALLVGASLPTQPAGAGISVDAVEPTERAVRDAAGVALGEATAADPAGVAAAIAALMPGDSAAVLDDTLALVEDVPEHVAAIATARAAGVAVHLVPAGATDPQSSAPVIDALHASPATRTLAIGPGFATEPALDWQVRAARSGFQLPGGGQRVFDGRQFVALYGTPGASVLGVLGEQGADAAIERARGVAAPYGELTDRTVVPMFEIITTVASASAGDDGDYSNELAAENLLPWVEAAGDAGMYVVLDLQPGRTDFLTQAQRYRSLLELPHVGLALDPEWRLAADQVHLRQIGSVSAAEVNDVIAWVADLTNELGLPPKMLVLHQFRLDMIADRSTLDLSRPELEVVVHVDGLGTPAAKLTTWAVLQRDAPAGLHWGWKNFYDEDRPMLTPAETIELVSPTPELITYQ